MIDHDKHMKGRVKKETNLINPSTFKNENEKF